MAGARSRGPLDAGREGHLPRCCAPKEHASSLLGGDVMCPLPPCLFTFKRQGGRFVLNILVSLLQHHLAIKNLRILLKLWASADIPRLPLSALSIANLHDMNWNAFLPASVGPLAVAGSHRLPFPSIHFRYRWKQERRGISLEEIPLRLQTNSHKI